jgi:hypothetical protein
MAKDEDRKKKKKRKSVAADSGMKITSDQTKDNDTDDLTENAPIAELTQVEDEVTLPAEESVQNESKVGWLSLRSNVQV